MSEWFDSEENSIDLTPAPKRVRPFYLLLVLLIVAGLLGSGFYGVAWFLHRDANQFPGFLPAPAEVQIPGPNRIAFIDPDGQVKTIDPDGGNGQVLTATDKRYVFPAWSPDGRSLAVIGQNSEGGGVYLIQDEVGTAVQEKYFSQNQAPFYLYWSPDSSRVSFLAAHAQGNLGMHVVGTGQEAASDILATGSPFYWVWTADSARILVHSGFSGEGSRLAFLNINQQQFEAAIARPGFFQAPDISADGRYLAYAESDENGISRLVIQNTETGIEKRERHAGLLALGWSPVENQLAVISSIRENRSFNGPLRMLDMATGEMDVLSKETVLAFFWSPDGRYIAAFHVGNLSGNEIFAGKPASARSSKRLTQFSLPDLNLSLIDVASRFTLRTIRFQPTPTFFSQFLPFFDQYALSHQIWSPDSEALVIPVSEDGVNKIVVIPVNGDHRVELGEGDMPFWSR